MRKIQTPFTKLLKIDLPIIAAPMFLVSNEDIVVRASEAGAVGAFPALNYRPVEKYAEALKAMRTRTKKPIGVNIIVNKSNTRQDQDLKIALDHGVDFFITSLGSPKKVIQDAHKNGAKVFCDVTNLEHALKVEDLGADGVIAVGQGAGGHAGPISLLVLIPWLKSRIKISIVAAGGISHGSQIAACLALGADAVSIGTRFIASREAQVDEAYKQAILSATPEDIVLSTRISGTPASLIRTPYVEKMGTELPWVLRRLKENELTKKYVIPLIHLAGMKSLENSARKSSWKQVWSAGQSVGLIDKISTTEEIIHQLMIEFDSVRANIFD